MNRSARGDGDRFRRLFQPEALAHGRPFNAMSTALGFLLGFVLSDL